MAADVCVDVMTDAGEDLVHDVDAVVLDNEINGGVGRAVEIHVDVAAFVIAQGFVVRGHHTVRSNTALPPT